MKLHCVLVWSVLYKIIQAIFVSYKIWFILVNFCLFFLLLCLLHLTDFCNVWYTQLNSWRDWKNISNLIEFKTEIKILLNFFITYKISNPENLDLQLRICLLQCTCLCWLVKHNILQKTLLVNKRCDRVWTHFTKFWSVC